MKEDLKEYVNEVVRGKFKFKKGNFLNFCGSFLLSGKESCQKLLDYWLVDAALVDSHLKEVFGSSTKD